VGGGRTSIIFGGMLGTSLLGTSTFPKVSLEPVFIGTGTVRFATLSAYVSGEDIVQTETQQVLIKSLRPEVLNSIL